MLSKGATGMAGAGRGGGGGAIAEDSLGFSTRKMPPHELQRTLTPPAGTLAESTGNPWEQDGHMTVMTMDRFGSGFDCGRLASLIRHQDVRFGSGRRGQRRRLVPAVDHVLGAGERFRVRLHFG